MMTNKGTALKYKHICSRDPDARLFWLRLLLQPSLTSQIHFKMEEYTFHYLWWKCNVVIGFFSFTSFLCMNTEKGWSLLAHTYMTRFKSRYETICFTLFGVYGFYNWSMHVHLLLWQFYNYHPVYWHDLWSSIPSTLYFAIKYIWCIKILKHFHLLIFIWISHCYCSLTFDTGRTNQHKGLFCINLEIFTKWRMSNSLMFGHIVKEIGPRLY